MSALTIKMTVQLIQTVLTFWEDSTVPVTLDTVETPALVSGAPIVSDSLLVGPMLRVCVCVCVRTLMTPYNLQTEYDSEIKLTSINFPHQTTEGFRSSCLQTLGKPTNRSFPMH